MKQLTAIVAQALLFLTFAATGCDSANAEPQASKPESSQAKSFHETDFAGALVGEFVDVTWNSKRRPSEISTYFLSPGERVDRRRPSWSETQVIEVGVDFIALQETRRDTAQGPIVETTGYLPLAKVVFAWREEE
ncbi:MAG: hypothetical protein AAF663_00475 [Planctomycetota bacterium]